MFHFYYLSLGPNGEPIVYISGGKGNLHRHRVKTQGPSCCEAKALSAEYQNNNKNLQNLPITLNATQFCVPNGQAYVGDT